MKESHKRICAFAVVAGWLYLGCSLTVLDLNPLRWPEAHRWFLAFGVPIIATMAAACPIFDEV